MSTPLVEVSSGLKYTDYTVALICPRSEELRAVKNMLDELHFAPSLPNNQKNVYTFGRIYGHNVILACPGEMGQNGAAILGARMDSTFRLRFALLVGIAGGLGVQLQDRKEIFLGDVVISIGYGEDGRVVSHDRGQQTEGSFRSHSFLNGVPEVLRRAFAKLEYDLMNRDNKITSFISTAKERNSTFQDSVHPDPKTVKDILFNSEYKHQGPEGNGCIHCDKKQIKRTRTSINTEPYVHFGHVASSNQVVMDSEKRAKILNQHPKALAIEMEGATLMNIFGCATIRGVCDYADDHKNYQWRLYAAATAAAAAKEVLGIIPVDQVMAAPVLPTTGPISTLPSYLINIQDFVGRDDILSEIGERFKKNPRVSIVGIGGIGKTRIAVEYALKNFLNDHPEGHVYWIYAATTASFDDAYVDIAEKLKIPGRTEERFNHRKAVQEWLQKESIVPWLMILDNIDDSSLVFTKENATAEEKAESIEWCLPSGTKNGGKMIITSRSRDLGRYLALGGEPVKIDTLTTSNAKSLLSIKINNRKKWDERAAEVLVGLLDCSPLAITQAAAFINKVDSSSIIEYLGRLRREDSSITEMLSEELQDPARPGIPNAIFRTWRQSYLLMARERPGAARLLSLMSIFANQEIPEILLIKGQTPNLEEKGDIQTLIDFHLIRAAADGLTYGMHRLVQLSTHEWLRSSPTGIREWEHCGVAVLEKRFPPFWKTGGRQLCRVLSPHAHAVSQYQCRNSPAFAALLKRIGHYDIDRGRYNTAFDCSLRSYEIYRELYGEIYNDTLCAKLLLGRILEKKNEIALCSRIFREVLDGKERLFGRHSLETLTLRGEIAVLMEGEGKYEEAGFHRLQIVQIREAAYGEENVEVLISLGNLANNLHLQRKCAEAERVFRRIISISERVLEPDDPFIFKIFRTLSSVLRDSGKLPEAEELIHKAVNGLQKKYGRDHQETLSALHEMGLIFAEQGNYGKSEETLQEVLSGSIEAIGMNHTDTLATFRELALVLYDQKKYEEALESMEQATDGFTMVLGPRHPDTNDALKIMQKLRRKAVLESGAAKIGEKQLAPLKEQSIHSLRTETSKFYEELGMNETDLQEPAFTFLHW